MKEWHKGFTFFCFFVLNQANCFSQINGLYLNYYKNIYTVTAGCIFNNLVNVGAIIFAYLK